MQVKRDFAKSLLTATFLHPSFHLRTREALYGSCIGWRAGGIWVRSGGCCRRKYSETRLSPHPYLPCNGGDIDLFGREVMDLGVSCDTLLGELKAFCAPFASSCWSGKRASCFASSSERSSAGECPRALSCACLLRKKPFMVSERFARRCHRSARGFACGAPCLAPSANA